MVITGTIVRDPLRTGSGEGIDDFSIEQADVVRGDVMSIEAHSAFILSARLETG